MSVTSFQVLTRPARQSMSMIQVTERYAHLAPTAAGTDKLVDPRLLQEVGTGPSPEQTNVVHLADFQSTNAAVARPDLVTGPVFKASNKG